MFLLGIEQDIDDENKIISQFFCTEIGENNKFATRDSVDVNDNIIKRRIGKTILTGAEEWKYDEKTKTYYFKQFNKFCENISGKYDRMMCTHFRWSKYKENLKYGEFQGDYKNNIMFNFDFGKDGVDNFRKWLTNQNSQGQPVEVYYILQNPIIIKNNSNKKFSIIENSKVTPIFSYERKIYTQNTI